MTEERPEYLTDALEMISNHPTVEIEPPRSVMSRRGREFVEEDKPAFIKFSTGFKKELAGIDEIALKVWIFIALSINRNSGKANPGLRTIAAGTGFAVNTVQSALVRLDKDYNLLAIDRESKRYNIYEPLAFVSANKADPTVSAGDTSVSVDPKSVSVGDESVSARVILNQRNQNNQINQRNEKIKLPEGSDTSWLIAAGVDSKEIASLTEAERIKSQVAAAWEVSMGYSPLDWGDKDLAALLKFLLTKTPQEIQTFATWSRRQFSTFDPAKARQYPRRVIDLWPQAFPVSTPRSEPYHEDESEYVIAPRLQKK